jgi:RNA polymerase sigma-70 factor (ECF subfamily)
MATTRHHPAEDELLAVRCQLGEAAAFDELIARWHPPLWSFIRRLVGDDDRAQEIVQEAWLRILRGLPRLRDGARLRAWLFGIARRTLMDRLRYEYAAAPTVDIDVDDVASDLAAPDDPENLQQLEAALADLPPVEREVVTLFYFEELSLNEVADVLNIPVGTVKSRLFRAKRLLRHNLVVRGVEP